jgi:hypothetical protein
VRERTQILLSEVLSCHLNEVWGLCHVLGDAEIERTSPVRQRMRVIAPESYSRVRVCTPIQYYSGIDFGTLKGPKQPSWIHGVALIEKHQFYGQSKLVGLISRHQLLFPE